ncbi:MAG: hypothetical protein ACK4TA_20845 [Saprospiraceae bacterium]
MKTIFSLCLLAFLLLFTSRIIAQERADSLIIIETKDGNEYLGTIQMQDSSQLVLLTANIGTIQIQRNDIKRIRPAGFGQMKDGKYWYENPHPTRYFYGPNGYGLRKGEGYYQNVWVLLNQVSYGFTNNFSLGAGIVPLFLFGEGNQTPFLINGQFSLPLRPEKMNLSVGGFYFNSIGGDPYYDDDFGDGVGILYGGVTLGSRDNNIHFLLGYGYDGYGFADAPLVSVSGTIRVSRRTYLMTENYFFDAGNKLSGWFSFGGRYAARRLAIDYGLMFPTDFDNSYLVAIPWLGIASPFGRAKGRSK